MHICPVTFLAKILNSDFSNTFVKALIKLLQMKKITGIYLPRCRVQTVYDKGWCLPGYKVLSFLLGSNTTIPFCKIQFK